MTTRIRLRGNFTVDDGVPDGEEHGYDSRGQLVCVIKYFPVHSVETFGTGGDVDTYHVSPGYVARLNAAVRWQIEGYPCDGVA